MARPPVRQQPQQRAGHPFASSTGSRGQLRAVDLRVPHIRQKENSTCRWAAWLAGNSAPCLPQCSKMLLFATQCIVLNIQVVIAICVVMAPLLSLGFSDVLIAILLLFWCWVNGYSAPLSFPRPREMLFDLSSQQHWVQIELWAVWICNSSPGQLLDIHIPAPLSS